MYKSTSPASPPFPTRENTALPNIDARGDITTLFEPAQAIKSPRQDWSSANETDWKRAGGHNGRVMASNEASGHRRRKSSLMTPLDGSSNAYQNSRPLHPHSNILEEDSSASPAQLSPVHSYEGSDSRTASDELELEGLMDGQEDDEELGLDERGKVRRKRRRRRGTLLDQRVVGGVGEQGAGEVSEREKMEADSSVVRNSLINGGLIGLW